MSSHIDEKRYSVLVDYLTSCKEGDLRDSRVYPFGATANEKRRILQQAAMFVLKERLLYYRATDAANEICLKRVIANAKERTNIIHAAMMALMVANLPYSRDKTRAKWPEGAPLNDKTAVGVADFLFTVFCRHGWPDIIISEQGREFINQLSSCLFKLTGLSTRLAVPITLKLMKAKENWDENIDAALYAYRIAKQDSSQFSPFFIMYNRNPRMAIDHEFSCKATTNVTGEKNTCTYDMEETYVTTCARALKKQLPSPRILPVTAGCMVESAKRTGFWYMTDVSSDKLHPKHLTLAILPIFTYWPILDSSFTFIVNLIYNNIHEV
eukprot:Em0006g398a